MKGLLQMYEWKTELVGRERPDHEDVMDIGVWLMVRVNADGDEHTGEQ
jgi:hypothetical protein